MLPECERLGTRLPPLLPPGLRGLSPASTAGGQRPRRGRRWRCRNRTPGHSSSDANLALVERLTALAERHGHSVLELAIAWLAAQAPVASVIAGATSPDQVRANVTAADWELGDDDLAEIEALAAGTAP